MRGTVTMTHREAEALNLELARAGKPQLRFIPIEHVGGAQMQTKGTPKIHFQSKTGELLTRSQLPASGSIRNRLAAPGKSNGSVSRKRGSVVRPPHPSSMHPAVANWSSAPPHAPSVTQQRSKRPKLQMRSSVGNAEENYELKACNKLLRELLRHPKAYPFAQPVDPNLVPDYYNIILNPADLGTIKKQLDKNMYKNAEAVLADVDRVWNNCFLYNGAESELAASARELKAIADKTARDIDDDVGGDSDQMREMKEMRKQMKKMMRDLQMQQQMQLQMRQMPVAMPNAAPARKVSGKQRTSGAHQYSMVPSASMAIAPVQQEDMSFEQKQQLSAAIQRLSSQNLSKVVKIIKQSMPSLGHGDDEVEIDLESLDNGTMWRLKTFVDNCAAAKKARPKKMPITNATRQQMIQQTQLNAQANLANIRSSIQTIDMEDSGPSSQHHTINAGSYSPSDSGSDDDGMALKQNAGAMAASGHLADFQNAKQQREKEKIALQQRELQEQQRLQAEQRRARERAIAQQQAQQRERERQRAAERAAREQEDVDFDLMGQSNMMASFEQNGALD